MHAHEPPYSHGRRLSVPLIVLGILLPIGGYWLLVGGTPTVTPWQAKRLLVPSTGSCVLVDVRVPSDFAAGHIDGAVNWPLTRVVAADTSHDLPPSVQHKTMLLLDDVGVASGQATRHLRAMGVADAWRVRGGIQEWIRSAEGPDDTSYARWRTNAEGTDRLPFREPVLADQIVSVTAFFVLKPIYTLLSLMVIVVLWRSTSPELVALKWGMLFFLVGENLCAVNVLGFQETSYLLEYGHSIGMVICLGFVTYAVLEGIDRRILGFSDPAHRCGAIGLCGRCIKNADVPCGLRRLFVMLILLCLLLAFMLPTADWHDQAYNTMVFGQFYHYGHLRVFQWLETWGCGGAAIMLLATSLATVLWGRDKSLQRAKITFSAGIGALGFGLLRTVIGGLYDQSRVWYGFWEEATELLLLSGICFVLWTFRSQLLPSWDRRARQWREQLVGILRAD